MKSKQEARRERVYKFYLGNRSQGKKFTVDHFKAENIPKRTIYSIIQRAENESGHERVNGSGRIAKIMSKKNIRSLKTMFDHNDRVSQRQAARRFKCSPSFINYTLKTKTTIKKRKKMKIPKRTDGQKASAQTKCGRLYRISCEKSIILDDESYFTLAHSTINSNNIFYSSNVSQTSPTVKYMPTAKYEKKLLVWLCFSDKGISKPIFRESGFAVNQEIYLHDCIKKKLVPFIEQYHSDGEYIFWPDLASSHYANSVQDYMNEKNINFVKKEDNPANLPECRPIEDFWSILKGKVYEKNWQAQNLNQLRNRIKYCLDNIDKAVVQRLAESTRRRIDYVRRNGLIEMS